MIDIPLYTAKAEPLTGSELDDWFAGRRPRKYNILPFGGPIKGSDLDGERFTKRTDPKPDWFSERPVIWHHGKDPTGIMGDALLGKAVGMEKRADGWWSDIWLNFMERRLTLVRDLAEKALAKGQDLMGSTQPIASLIRKAADGEILVWPVAEYSLTVSPQNTWSRPMKALLEDFDSASIPVHDALKAFLSDLDNLGADLPLTSHLDGDAGDAAAKAGRVLSARNEQALREALTAFQSLLDEMVAQRNQSTPTEGDASA
jgi:hypothetical protein